MKDRNQCVRQEEEKVMLCFVFLCFQLVRQNEQTAFSGVYFQNLVLEMVPYSLLFAESVYVYLLCSVVFSVFFNKTKGGLLLSVTALPLLGAGPSTQLVQRPRTLKVL